MYKPLSGLSRQNIIRESLAGVTLLAIAVPLNIGYAQIAGLPPTAGLYAMILPSIIYALTVSSRQVVASPDAAAAALVASSVGGLAVAGSGAYATMAVAQAIISGVLFLLASYFRLGFLANFLSKPILIGFVGGLALDIMVSQIAKMLGVSIESGGEFTTKLVGLVSGLGTANPWSILIAALSVSILVIGKRLAPYVPWALLVLIVTTILLVLSGLESSGVSVLGHVESGAPAIGWPDLDLRTWLALVPSAIALTMVTTAEGLLVSRSYAEKHGYGTRPNRDLMAFGLANISSGVTGGFAVGSSTSRTAAMDQAGSRTQWPAIVAAVGTLALLLFGTGLLENIPAPAIGAIVAVAIMPLLGFVELRQIWDKDRFEFVIGAACFLGTLFIGAIPGILIAFTLALVNLARSASTPSIDIVGADGEATVSLLDPELPIKETAPGILVVRFSAPLFFANAAALDAAVRRAVAESTEPIRHVVIDLRAVTDVDVTAAETIESLHAWLTGRQVELGFSRVRQPLRERLETLGLLSNARVHTSNRSALDDLG
ncbi:SulP family inorganic anion transporter [Paeniglutamicibacter sp. R2-26]|uniref:SulP family inorganic anion transporter n=1 Tax=Paeniglutamicibacter sp. R2-26 TaxID=3144417 RepID=UPI003EE6C207